MKKEKEEKKADTGKAKKELIEEIQQTAEVRPDETDILPKGVQPEEPEESEPAPPQQEPGPEKKRGRPKGSKNKADDSAQVPESREPVTNDVLTPAINGLLIPIIAKKTNRDVSKMMFTQEEMNTLKQLQPPNDFTRPNWVTYIITAVSLIAVHYFTTDEIKEDEPEKK